MQRVERIYEISVLSVQSVDEKYHAVYTRFWNSPPPNILARAVRHRRPGRRSHPLGGLLSLCRAKAVADSAARPHRFWRLAVSMFFGDGRQPLFDQPGETRRRRRVDSKR